MSYPLYDKVIHAISTTYDVGAAEVLRKAQAGDLLEHAENATEVPSISRAKFLRLRDKKPLPSSSGLTPEEKV